MSSIKVNCGNIEISNDNKICIIAGPCQLETEQHAIDMAGKIKEITKKFNLGFIYKTSFDKANRTSLKEFTALWVTLNSVLMQPSIVIKLLFIISSRTLENLLKF